MGDIGDGTRVVRVGLPYPEQGQPFLPRPGVRWPLRPSRRPEGRLLRRGEGSRICRPFPTTSRGGSSTRARANVIGAMRVTALLHAHDVLPAVELRRRRSPGAAPRRALADRGHEVTVRALTRGLPGAERRRRRSAPSENPGVSVVPVDAGAGALSPLATYLTGRPLLTRGQLERVLGRGFDVLHFHNPSLLGGPALLGMGEGLKLYTLHEQWLVCPTHVLFKYRAPGVREAATAGAARVTYRRPPQPWRSTGLLERSLDARRRPDRPEPHHGAACTTASPTGCGSSACRTSSPTPAAGPAATASAPVLPVRRTPGGDQGRGHAARGFPPPALRGPGDRGDGPLLGALRRQASDLPHVRFRAGGGPRARRRSTGAPSRSVVPTLGHESFPLVLLEAFARGTPALVRRFGALAELAEESGAALAYFERGRARRGSGSPGRRRRRCAPSWARAATRPISSAGRRRSTWPATSG